MQEIPTHLIEAIKGSYLFRAKTKLDLIHKKQEAKSCVHCKVSAKYKKGYFQEFVMGWQVQNRTQQNPTVYRLKMQGEARDGGGCCQYVLFSQVAWRLCKWAISFIYLFLHFSPSNSICIITRGGIVGIKLCTICIVLNMCHIERCAATGKLRPCPLLPQIQMEKKKNQESIGEAL